VIGDAPVQKVCGWVAEIPVSGCMCNCALNINVTEVHIFFAKSAYSLIQGGSCVTWSSHEKFLCYLTMIGFFLV